MKKKIEKRTRIHFTSAFFDAFAVVDAKKQKNPFWFYPGRWLNCFPTKFLDSNGREPKLVPGVLSLASRKKNRIKSKNPGCSWKLKVGEGKKSK